MTKLATYKSEFDDLGYTIIPNFITPETAAALKEIAAQDDVLKNHAHAVLDNQGRESKLTLWYTPGDDVFGRLSCSDLLQRYMRVFLDGDVSFFHAKLMNKEPKLGGQWEWHQDYGYWYEDGFPTADMGSCFVALDQCTQENGALRVIPKSHRCGRIEHGVTGQQAGADLDAVTNIKEENGVVLCEMNAGDALFFHSNTLHASGPNTSNNSRLILISSFFRKDNESAKKDRRYRNKDIPTVAHDTILEGRRGLDPNLNFSNATDHIIS